ncbi:hypothetical protein MPER_12210, partial [Moniliophthora perniciosa FA553]
EKLSPNEKAAYQLGQQSMARPAPKASGSKKGKGKAKEAPLPDPCMACVAAKAQHECVTQQDAKNAVACNRCRHKKLQCSWRSSKGPDLSLVEIEEQLGRMVDVQEETLAWTKRLVGAIEEANEFTRGTKTFVKVSHNCRHRNCKSCGQHFNYTISVAWAAFGWFLTR